MEIINLDKFNNSKQIKIGDKAYIVRAFSVGDYISGKYDNVDLDPNDPKAGVRQIIKFVAEFTDIPMDEIKKFGMEMLTAISTIIQGGEVDAGEGDGGKGNA